MRGGNFPYDPDSGSPISPTPWLLNVSGLAHAAVERVVKVDWTGDSSNDRSIDMEIECDLVLVQSLGDFASSATHLALAYAFDTGFGVFIELSSVARHMANNDSDCTNRWQGIVAGTRNILLSAVGAQQDGTNRNTRLYRAIGFKFRNFP